MTPLFKRGARARQVSLTYCCCKVIKHIVHSRLMKFLESNKILNDFQHGLRKSRSCETQLITTIHNLAVGPDRRQVGAILLEFSKNFEKAPYHSPGSQSSIDKKDQSDYSFPSEKSFKFQAAQRMLRQMLHVHSWSTTRVCFDGMGPCNKIQHCQILAPTLEDFKLLVGADIQRS